MAMHRLDFGVALAPRAAICDWQRPKPASQSEQRCRRLHHTTRPVVALGKRTDHLGPAPRLTPSRIGNERKIGQTWLPRCTALQPTLTKCGLLQPTLTKIADECDRTSRYISTAIAEADFEKWQVQNLLHLRIAVSD